MNRALYASLGSSLFSRAQSYSQYWKEEPEVLARLLNSLPDGATIVEIGTADGASAALLHDTLAARGATIWSVDICTSSVAQSLLKGSCVTLVTMSSQDAAVRWHEFGGTAVDLLLVDGDHTLAGVAEDASSWFPHLADGALVIFHDCDPPERGGAAHLGVRIFLDAVLASGGLRDTCQQYRFFWGRRYAADPALPDVQMLERGFAAYMGELYERTQQLCSCGVQSALQYLRQRRSPDGLTITTALACCCLEYLLQHHLQNLRTECENRAELIQCAESLTMLKHAYGASPWMCAGETAGRDLRTLSAAVAAQQVRLFLLKSVLAHVVPWMP